MDLSEQTQEYLKNYFDILQTLINEMNNVEVSTSISANFITQMLVMFEAGMSMCDNVLNYTTNEQLINIVNEMKQFQQNGIDSLMRVYNNCVLVENTSSEVNNYQRTYKSIIDSMFNSMLNTEITNNIDMNFINEMIPHHLGAVYMAKNAMRFNVCKELLMILNNIIIFQTRSIMQLRLLKENMN
jgi:uncharacterized protein (DUF305 family)